jgi:hypothetical protein
MTLKTEQDWKDIVHRCFRKSSDLRPIPLAEGCG